MSVPPPQGGRNLFSIFDLKFNNSVGGSCQIFHWGHYLRDSCSIVSISFTEHIDQCSCQEYLIMD